MSSRTDALTEALRYAAGRERGAAPAPANLSHVEPQALIDATLRQRVAIVLTPWLADLHAPAESVDVISKTAAQHRLYALGCAAATSEASVALEAAGIRVLVIKGVALAAQTTGELTSRGPGDVDLWVHPQDAVSATAVLATLGYEAVRGTVLPDDATRRGRFARWADFEVTMSRPGSHLDVHWQLAAVRSGLPEFDQAWQEREHVAIGNREVATLGVQHALLHSCHHAFRDGWRWMRSLVDVDRLAHMADANDPRLSVGAVQLTAAAAFDLTASPQLEPLMAPAGRRARSAVATARRQQSRPNWTIPGEWSPRDTWDWGRQQAMLVGTPADVARAMGAWLLPPTLLVDDSGAPRSMRQVIEARLGSVGDAG